MQEESRGARVSESATSPWSALPVTAQPPEGPAYRLHPQAFAVPTPTWVGLTLEQKGQATGTPAGTGKGDWPEAVHCLLRTAFPGHRGPGSQGLSQPRAGGDMTGRGVIMGKGVSMCAQGSCVWMGGVRKAFPGGVVLDQTSTQWERGPT